MTTLSLHDLENLKRHPESKSVIAEYEARALGLYESYSDFVQRVNDEIDSVIRKMESARNYYKNQPEDAITHYICTMLQQKSMNASHGKYASGETDLTVEHGENLWIGEAKWWNQDENALEGMRQLSTRYATGGDLASSGGVLLYNKTGNLSEKIARLRAKYEAMQCEFTDIEVVDCPKSTFAFKTAHKNPASGLSYEVRHRSINLYHEQG